MTDFWENWGTVKTPIPANTYDMSLTEAKIEYDDKGRARTSLTFRVVDGGPYAARHIWLNWPHLPEKFGWLAKKIYMGMGFTERPSGDTPDEVMTTIGRMFTERLGEVFKVNVVLKKGNDGVERNQVNNVTRIATTQKQPEQAPPGYGGSGYADPKPMIEVKPDTPNGEPQPWSY